MKTLATTLILVSLTTGLFASNNMTGGKEKSKVNLVINASGNLELTLTEIPGEPLTLLVFDEQGNQVLSKLINCNMQSSDCQNIENFKAGSYTYQVTADNELIYEARIIKGGHGSIELQNIKDEVHASISQINTNLVRINLLKGKGQKAKIKIKDADGKLIYVRRVKKGEHRKLTHDISCLPSGSYTIGVFHENEMVALRKITK